MPARVQLRDTVSIAVLGSSLSSLQRARFDFTAAAGLFNSVVGMTMVVIADRLAKRMDAPGIF